MNVLVIGGTRLLGRAVVAALAGAGNSVTVLSRRAGRFPPGVEGIVADRSEGLNRLAGRCFDHVVDFLAYDGATAAAVLTSFPRAHYVLISSVWMVRLADEMEADELVGMPSERALAGLPDITRDYLLGKLAAENAVAAGAKAGTTTSIVRMPIFWGESEHTGRMRFYADRISDGGPVLMVNSGENFAQIAWTEDIARAFAAWLSLAPAAGTVCEALPHTGKKVREILADISSALGADTPFVGIEESLLSDRLPEYLQAEPLWREREITPTRANLFAMTGTRPTPQAEWLKSCAARGEGDARLATRDLEIALARSAMTC